MAVWKRVLLYLTRKKGRTVTMIILLIIMSCFVLIGLSLTNSADREIENLRQSLGSGFILKGDINNMSYYKPSEGNEHAKIYDGPMITDEMIQRILGIDGVENYDIETLRAYVWSELKLRPGLWTDSKGDGYLSAEGDEVMIKTTTLWCCRDGEVQNNFRTGALTISEGRNILTEDHFKAVISEQLAKRNGLSVGDTITVMVKEGNYKGSETPMKTWGEPIDLEIVGVFHMNFEQATSEYTPESSFMENIIYSDLETYHVILQALKSELPEGEVWDGEYTKVSFLTEDPLKLDGIMEQVKAMEDAEGLIIQADDTAYRAAARPYKQIGIFSRILLAVGIGGMGILLYLLMRLWGQGRRHEAGILLSVGIGKRKIVGQMLAESLTASVIAVCFSILASGVLVDACAGFAEQITAPKEDRQPYEMKESSVGEVEVIKTSADRAKLEHNVSVQGILLTIVLVCGVSSMSVLFVSIKITDIEPKKLLRSM